MCFWQDATVNLTIAWAEAEPHVACRFCTACWNGSYGRSCLWHRAPSQTWQVPWEATPRMDCLPKQAAAAACLPLLHRMAVVPQAAMALMLTWRREIPGGLHKVSLLCNLVLCCAALCCAALCCAVLCCAVLSWSAMFCAVPHCAVLCCAVLCCAVLCCAVLCCAVLSSAASEHNTAQSLGVLCQSPHCCAVQLHYAHCLDC